jgi:hypothetical protein
MSFIELCVHFGGAVGMKTLGTEVTEPHGPSHDLLPESYLLRQTTLRRCMLLTWTWMVCCVTCAPASVILWTSWTSRWIIMMDLLIVDLAAA